MRYIDLFAMASTRLLDDDNDFLDKSDRLVAALRSLDIIPTRRASVNGHLHKLLAAMLVTAYYEQTTVDVTTRRKGTLVELGLTSKFIEWLDKIVGSKMLVPRNGASKAVGTLMLGEQLLQKIE